MIARLGVRAICAMLALFSRTSGSSPGARLIPTGTIRWCSRSSISSSNVAMLGLPLFRLACRSILSWHFIQARPERSRVSHIQFWCIHLLQPRLGIWLTSPGLGGIGAINVYSGGNGCTHQGRQDQRLSLDSEGLLAPSTTAISGNSSRVVLWICRRDTACMRPFITPKG